MKNKLKVNNNNKKAKIYSKTKRQKLVNFFIEKLK